MELLDGVAAQLWIAQFRFVTLVLSQILAILRYPRFKFYQEPGVFKLLIIDSIISLFRVDFSGRGELADRQQKLAQMLSKVQKLRSVNLMFKF